MNMMYPAEPAFTGAAGISRFTSGPAERAGAGREAARRALGATVTIPVIAARAATAATNRSVEALPYPRKGSRRQRIDGVRPYSVCENLHCSSCALMILVNPFLQIVRRAPRRE